jgi:hypothetical protein
MDEKLLKLIDAYAHAKAVHAESTIENAAVTGRAALYLQDKLPTD